MVQPPTVVERSTSPLFGAKTERKRNVDDRRVNAMAALRAQRDARATRVETEQRKKAELQRKEDDEEDIEKIVAEKERFRSHPTNYAMKKTQLMKERDVAQLRGDEELVADLNAKLQELEERASALDKTRTSSIQSISYINNRNRKLNVETAEKAIMEEQQQSEAETAKKEKSTAVDSSSLYSLHDFDINIEIDLPVPKAVTSQSKQLTIKVKESGPKRSLNLEEYKKRHGLI
ncbi:unnamed protein product [Euphydryas editha]|uniref:Uncharacterized protein n=1 Tax=Euphydryas editha TaxID=104508 RepID=A0AAU9UIG6_EUPED|nr:unnamed protein product [Euphydryas editha]